jgi:hypothetical protein
MATTKWLFWVINGAFAFTIKTKLFNSVSVRNLFLFNEGGIALLYTARDHLKLWHWIWIAYKLTLRAMHAHCASAK